MKMSGVLTAVFYIGAIMTWEITFWRNTQCEKCFNINIRRIIDASEKLLLKLLTPSATSVQSLLFLSRSCTYTWSRSIMDNPLLVMNVVNYFPGKIHCTDTVLQAIQDIILQANSIARNVKGHSLGKRISSDTKWRYNDEEKFECRDCGKQFTRRDNLKGHIETLHFRGSYLRCSWMWRKWAQYVWCMWQVFCRWR